MEVREPVETWRQVVGWSEYEVSDAGRVRSGGVRILRPRVMVNGYAYVHLKRKGRRRDVGVHTLVLEAFAGPRPAGAVCRHFPDGTRTNNRRANLSWGTPAQNQADRIVHGTDERGERSPRAKLTAAQVADIRQRWRAGVQQRVLCAEYGISSGHMSVLCRGRHWSEVA